VKIKRVPDLKSSFDSWKFWLSSAAIFAGVLIVGLIPGCAKGAEPEHRYQGWTTQVEQPGPRSGRPGE
jgi:hypothetical protein